MKALVHQEMEILSSFTHPNVSPKTENQKRLVHFQHTNEDIFYYSLSIFVHPLKVHTAKTFTCQKVV